MSSTACTSSRFSRGEASASPGSERSAERAEDRRRIRQLHGHRRHRQKLGIAPLQPELDRIAALKQIRQLPALLAHLHAIGVNAFFGMGSNQDYADANSVIGFYARRPRPAGARLLHPHRRQIRGAAPAVRRSCEEDLQARRRAEAAGRQRCETVLKHRNPPGRKPRSPSPSSATRRISITPRMSPLSRQRAHALFAGLVSHRCARSGRGKINDMEPKFLAEFNKLIADTPLDQIKAPTCAGTCCTPTPAPACLRASITRPGTSTRTPSTARRSSRSAGSAAPAASMASWAKPSARSTSPALFSACRKSSAR
jgi:hypothetical protein